MLPMNSKSPLTVTITPGTIITVVLVLLGFWLLFYLHELVLVVLTAVILASAIEPATLRMMSWGLPRILSVVLLYLSVFATLALGFYLFVPILVDETRNLVTELPTYLKTLQLEEVSMGLFDEEGLSLTDQISRLQDVLVNSGSGVLAAASTIFGGLLSFVLIIVLTFYFAVREQGLNDFLRLVTPMKKQEYIFDLWKRAQHKMGRWLQGQLLLSLLVGVLVYIGLSILGVPYAFLLAIIAAVLELVPVFGSILAAVPAVIVSFIDGGATQALLVIALYTVVNQVQGNIVYPLVVQKVLGVSPLVVILAIIVGYQLAGFLGVLIAVPVAAAIQEYINDVQKGRAELAYPAEDGTLREEPEPKNAV